MKRGMFMAAGAAMLVGTVACGTPKAAEKTAETGVAAAGAAAAEHSCGAAKGKEGCCGADMTHEKMAAGCCGAKKVGDATCGEGSCGSAPAPK